MTNNNARAASICYDCSSVCNIKSTLTHKSTQGYSYCCVSIAHPHFKRELLDGKSKNRKGPFTRSDLSLNSYEDWAAIIGKTSPYLNYDSSNETLRKLSEATLLQELSYAIHLSLNAVIVPVRGANVSNLARLLLSKLVPTTSIQIWIKIPLLDPSIHKNYFYKNEDENLEASDTWLWWNQLRIMTGSNKRLGVVLEVGADLPSEIAVMRWLGEPLRALILPTHLFLTNKKGYPVLSKAHQTFIKTICQSSDVSFIISGSTRHDSLSLYQKYIEHITQRKPSDDPTMTYTEGYEDFLQYPLQPLADNLESQTYEVFEKDPIKYIRYQSAIYEALKDRVKDEEKDTRILIVMVVGAGRGPLVSATLNAAKASNRKVKVYAVEKNPNAIVTLETKNQELWDNEVTVVSSDMRKFQPPELADIIVSELLGSFGDNELSPECLDGAQNLMKDDAISIPASYTSYLSPIQSMKLHNEVKSYKERNISHKSHFEMPYVVHQKNKYSIDDPQELFTFHHPNNEKEPDNSRYSSLSFDVKTSCVLHGFSGYFSAVLYKEIVLSIHPETHTPGMFSWFPIYFPIKEPVHLNEGDKLVVHFWRLMDKEKVWYEWCISEPKPISIHNPNGRSYCIKLH